MSGDPMELSTGRLFASLVQADPPCRANPELFFEPEERETTAQRALREQGAAAICLECPAYWMCLAWAVRTQPEYGIHAGYTPKEIRVLASAYDVEAA